MDFMVIINIILAAVLLFATLADFWSCLRYNVHMFQLNGYKIVEHKKWLSQNESRQRFLLFALPAFVIAGVVMMGASGWLSLLAVAFHGLSMLGYVLRKKYFTKKALAFTNRVKRLIVALCIVFAVVCGLFGVVFTFGRPFDTACFLNAFAMSLTGLTFFTPILLVFVNRLMQPVEKHINQGFINDAKRILASHKDLMVIGVTGSYGKTSLKYFLQAMLREKYNVCITPASFNTPMGVVRTIREELKPTHDVFICEMGAKHVGDIKELCDIVHPKHGVITSVGPQHLETFLTIDNVRNTKFELEEALPADGMLFVNSDSEEALKGGEERRSRGRNVVYYGGRDGYYADNIQLSPLGTDFTVHTPDGRSVDLHMSLIGKVNILNVLGAIAVADTLGVPPEDLRIPVRRLLPVKHRMELTEHHGYSVIDDAYNSNPVGSKAAVETLGMFDGARILITPGMVELGSEEDRLHYEFGKAAAPNADYILLVNKYRTGFIKKGVLEAGFNEANLFEFDNFTEAFDFALKIKDERHKFILLENDLPDNF